MTCNEVCERLDLLAADACDPEERQALEAHLQTCAACSECYAESERMIGLLDVHFDASGLDRLRQHIDQQAWPATRRRWFTSALRRGLAAAALVLIAIGLGVWMPTMNDAEPRIALLARPFDREFDVKPEIVHAVPARNKDWPAVLFKLERDGNLPLPPRIDMELVLINRGRHPIDILFGDAMTRLTLEIVPDKVIRIPAPKAPLPEILQPRLVHLKPGDRHRVAIDRMIAGTRDKLEYSYFKAPGDYEVTAGLRVTAGSKIVEVVGPPTRVRVAD